MGSEMWIRDSPYGDDTCLLTEQTTNLGIRHLYIIATGNTASASELVISGLRGLDVPVTIVGARTEGKNCGMDVMVRTIDRYDYEFAPITFLNYNAKGFNEFSDGFEPDVDIATYFKDDANQSHVNNASMFPMPLAPWGMASYNIALMETMMRITGGTFKTETAEPAPAAVTRGLAPSRITLQQPERPGMTLTEQEREQNVSVPLSSLLYLSGSQELRSYYDAAMTQEYQTPEIEWPDGGSTTVYVKSGDQD